ncbi:MAG: hypothetical protein M3O61_11455 [Gemmatimonadota bacterium]|nr:hypothetical protein [Gemmatimonadota bacterium]
MKGSITVASLMITMLSPEPSSVEAQSTAVRRPPLPATVLARPRNDSVAIRQPSGRIPAGAVTTLAPGAATATVAPAFQPPPAPRHPTSARTAISRARLERILGGPSAAIRVIRPSGVTNLPTATDSVRIVPGDLIFRKMSDTAHRIVATASTGTLPAASPTDAVYAMPYSLLTVDLAGVERTLVPRFIVKGGALTYDPQLRKYRGTAIVGLEDTVRPGRVPLAQPFELQLTTTTGGTISPDSLAIDHTSLQYRSTQIESTDSTNVRIRTTADPTGFVIGVPVRDMRLNLIPSPRSIEGFGLATTDIMLTLPRDMARGDSATVDLSGSTTQVRPKSVLVRGFGSSSVRLRSGLPGQDTIRAYIDGAFVGETVVTFKRPWTFLGATLIGILLGGFARFVSAKRRKRARALYWDIVRGSPFGVIAAAASAIGLDLAQLKIEDPGAWIAVMVTAAFGAWIGARILDRTATPPAPPPEPSP